MNEVVGSPRQRFLRQGNLYQGFSFSWPKEICWIQNKEFPKNVLSKLYNIPGLDIDREVVKDAFPRLARTFPDEYERDALGEYPEDGEASDGENNQDDGNGVSSIEPTRSKQDSDTDSN